MQVDFSATFDMVNHQILLFKLWTEGTSGSVWSILSQFLSNRLQHVMVDVNLLARLSNVVSGLPQGSVLGPLLFLLFTSLFFYYSRE